MKTWIALLRAANVGGHNRLKMADLKSLCEALGFRDVRTYLQSGNAIFQADGARADLEARLEEALAKDLGLPLTVMVRTPADLRQALEANPYANDDPTKVLIGFFDRAPEQVESLKAPEGDGRFTIRGDVLFLDLPQGAGRTKLGNAFFEKKLGCRVTTRNLRVVQALAET